MAIGPAPPRLRAYIPMLNETFMALDGRVLAAPSHNELIEVTPRGYVDGIERLEIDLASPVALARTRPRPYLLIASSDIRCDERERAYYWVDATAETLVVSAGTADRFMRAVVAFRLAELDARMRALELRATRLSAAPRRTIEHYVDLQGIRHTTVNDRVSDETISLAVSEANQREFLRNFPSLDPARRAQSHGVLTMETLRNMQRLMSGYGAEASSVLGDAFLQSLPDTPHAGPVEVKTENKKGRAIKAPEPARDLRARKVRIRK